MENKLLIEQLAPYLPYNLKGVYNLNEVINTDKNEVREKLLTEDCIKFFRLYCKPILRPLSDLIKPISTDAGFSIIFNYIFEYCHEYASRHPNQKILSNTANSLTIVDFIKPISLSYTSFRILLENHFDVFGLIEKGLAIDINSLTTK